MEHLWRFFSGCLSYHVDEEQMVFIGPRIAPSQKIVSPYRDGSIDGFQVMRSILGKGLPVYDSHAKRQ
jgi:hypothetical protein